MPQTQLQDTFVSTPDTQLQSEVSFNHFGTELEYPVASNPDRVPYGGAQYSSNLRNHFGRGEDWHIDEAGISQDSYRGHIGSDHVGAEIRSSVLDLHTEQPEVWYYRSIERAEEAGYPFAARGNGSTNFGLHMHLSSLSDEQVDFISELSTDPVMAVFVCTSVGYRNDLCPWRRGGGGSSRFDPDRDSGWIGRNRVGDDPDNYEWRLPEPMLPAHFGMVMHFLRLVSLEEFDEAEEYVRDRVNSRDDRITSIQQCRIIEEIGDLDGMLSTPSYTQQERLHNKMAEVMGYD